MNAWIQHLGLDAVKPLLTTLLLPPVPWLLLMVLGALLATRRRAPGLALVLAGALLEWLSCSAGPAELAARVLLDPPPALAAPQALSQAGAERSVIVVLGGGRSEAAEYDGWTLNPLSMERLRYGVWLARASGLPVGFSGGLSPGSNPGPTEAELAERIARDELRHPLAWVESRSRDTRENALRTVELLRGQGIGRVVLVTHELHQPRARRHFERARDAAGESFAVIAAPVAVPVRHDEGALGDWYPTAAGIARMRYVLREWLGLLAGA